MTVDQDSDTLDQINALKRDRRPSGATEWDYAVIVLRTAAVLAARRGYADGIAGHVAAVVAALAPNAWPIIQIAARQPTDPLGEALEELGIPLTLEPAAADAALCNDVLAVARDVESRRSALVRLSDGQAVQVIVVSHALPFIPELYTGLCLLNRTLLDEAIVALPGQHTGVWESLEDRVVLHFGPSIDAATWRASLRERWQHRLREIFSDAAENHFGPLSNVLLLTTGQSQCAPVGYVPRPLVAEFSRAIYGALTQKKASAILEPGTRTASLEEAVENTREWLHKNLATSGYKDNQNRLTSEEALAQHPAAGLADAVGLGLWGAGPLMTAKSKRTCIYCGGAAERTNAPEMAEGTGVKKFSKRWAATGNRDSADLCVRCSIASFLQLRRLGCYSAGLKCGPRKFFAVYHQGVYSNHRLEFLGRWADAYYILLKDGNLITHLGAKLRRGKTQEGDDAEEGASEPISRDPKRALKRLRDTLAEIQAKAAELRDYLTRLRERLPEVQADTGISPDEIDYLADQLDRVLSIDPQALDDDGGARVIELVEAFEHLDLHIERGVSQTIVSAFRRGADNRETGIAVHDLGGPATARLVLLALPTLPAAMKGAEWIDLSRRFSASRAAVTLTMGWLWRQYPGTYWWGMPIGHDDSLIHTPYCIAGEREIRQFEVAWTIARQIVPQRDAEYPQLLSWAEQLVDDPVRTIAHVLRRQGDTRPSLRRLSAEQLATFVAEVSEVGLD